MDKSIQVQNIAALVLQIFPLPFSYFGCFSDCGFSLKLSLNLDKFCKIFGKTIAHRP